MTVEEKMQEVLDWSGIKQNQLAQLTGISTTTISGYLHKKRKLTVEAMLKIAKALDVSPWIFLNGEPLPIKAQDLTESEREHLRQYRMLADGQREAVDHTIREFNKKR